MTTTVVANSHTRKVVGHMLRDTTFVGAEAVLRHLPRIEPGQRVAAMVLLAKAAAPPEPPKPTGVTLTGETREKPVTLTPEQMRRAHSRWNKGDREPDTVEGERQYQRVRGRRRAAARRAALSEAS